MRGVMARNNGNEQRKVQKSELKEELMSIAWHSSKWCDWSMIEDEKKETEKF